METGTVHLSIESFKISYLDQKFPLAPDGSPTEIDDYPDGLALDMLLDIPRLLSGEIRYIDFRDCPGEMVFIPWGNEITIFLNSGDKESHVNWQQITIPTGAWFSAVIEATRKYIDDVPNSGIEPVWTTLEEIQYLHGFAKKLLRVHGYLESKEDILC